MLNFGAVWGIDVGDSALKAVKLKRVGKRIALLDFHVIRYSDIGGEPGARREGMLPQALVALQQAGLRGERCIVSIAPQMVFNRFISLPPVDRRRIPEIVLYEAKQQIPFNLNEVVWAYEPIRKEFVLGEEIEIGLFAAKREVIDAYLAELSPVRRQLHGVQVSPLALFNFIRHEVAIEKPTVVIDVGAQSTNLLILDGQRFWLRNLPIAGNSFTTMLEKRLNIPRAEAEKLKYTVADSRHRRRLLEVLRPVMRDLVAEIQRSVGYYKSLSQQVKFEEILVTGEGYKLFGLDRFLAEQLQYQITPVHSLKNILWQGAPARQKELEQNLPSLGVAIGLGLQGLDAASATINLLPENFIIERELRSKRFSGLVAAALIWAIVGCLYAGGQENLNALNGLAHTGENTLKKVIEYDRRLKEAEQGLNPAREKTFDQFGRHREYYSRLAGSISAIIPREIQIDKFTFTEPAAAGSPGMSVPRATGAGGAAQATDEEKLVAGASIVVVFTASCEGKEPEWLQKNLPEALAKAVIYPDKIRTIKADDAFTKWWVDGEHPLKAPPAERSYEGHMAISVGPVLLRTEKPAAAGRPGIPTPASPMFPTVPAEPAAPKTQEYATIMIGLISPAEADDLMKKLPEKRAKEAQEKAAAELAATQAAAAVTPTPAPPPVTPPAPGRRP